jgi:streptogramin lyase
VVVAVVIAVVQVVRPSGSQTAKETAASKALLGKCLAEHGTSGGHPKYTSATVPCDSSSAAVKVVAVIPSTPGSPLCAAGTTGVELPYPGVQYPHVMCVQPVRPAPSGG